MSDNNISSNKRIAQNTLVLYLRMFMTMVIGLYTSRVIIQTLGVEDYGIYNAVAGFISMFGFFNVSMAGATQRFLNYAMGEGNSKQLLNIFRISYTVHTILAFVILLLCLSVGLWFLYNKMVIPEPRFNTAVILYFLSVLSFFVTIIFSPCSAVILAHEKMSFYAYISILDIILKLLIVYLLLIFDSDKLLVYSVLLFVSTIIVQTVNILYCKKHFSEVSFSYYYNRDLAKKIFSFSGWLFLGTFSLTLNSQGINLLINIFFGPLMNAARGVAYQVQAAVTSLVNNFMVAVTPQITKSYASGDLIRTQNLVFTSSRLGFFLIIIIGIPLLLACEELLRIWLGVVPDMSVLFVRLTIIDLFISIFFTPLGYLNQASGKIKKYQIMIAILFLSVFVLSYCFFKFGFQVYYTFYISILVSIIGLFSRLFYLRKSLNFPIIEYIKSVMVPSIVVCSLYVLLTYIIYKFIPILTTSLWMIIIYLVLTITIGILLILSLGLTKQERLQIFNFFKQKIK